MGLQGNNAMETSEKIYMCSIYGQEDILTSKYKIGLLSLFCRNILEDEPTLGYALYIDEALQSLVESNAQQGTLELAKMINTSQSTIC